MGGIHCPSCRHPEVRVVDSRPSQGNIRRRRLCLACGHKFSSYEVAAAEGDVVRAMVMWNRLAALSQVERAAVLGLLEAMLAEAACH